MDVIGRAVNMPVAVAAQSDGGRLAAMLQQVEKNFAAIKGPALLFTSLELVDGLMTMWATNNGFTETNHLVVSYAQTWLFPAFKLLTVVTGAVLLLPFVRKYPRYVRIGLILASVFMAAVLVSNLYEIGMRVI
jgi:hypothetical protein